MEQNNIIVASPGIKLAKAFLSTLQPAPWRLSAAGQLQAVPESRLATFAENAEIKRLSVYAHMPEMDGMVRHVIVHAPSSLKAPVPPTIVISAKECTMIWALSSWVAIGEADKAARKLAKMLGGRSGVGGGVPLPGTTCFGEVGKQLTGRWPVQMLPPSRTVYSLADGQLSRPAKPATPVKNDPRLLTVSLGSDQDGQSVVWQPGTQSNGFCLVLGASGSGKTETLKVLGHGVHNYGVPVLIFDFHGDVRIPGVQDILLSSGSDSTRGLNPMELDGICGKESGLYDQRGSLREMILRACPMLGHRQANALREAIEQAYRQAGIMDDDPATWGNQPPTFADLMELIEDDGLKAGVAELFGHPIFGRPTHIGVDGLLSSSWRLDLSKLSDGTRFVATESLLQRIFRNLRSRGPISVSPIDDSERFRLFVLIDEAKILAMGGGANILDTLATEARKFGLGMILASQMAEHFSSDVRANSATWLVLKPQEISEARKNAPNVGVEPEQLLRLKGRGDGYYRDRAANAARRIQVRPL